MSRIEGGTLYGLNKQMIREMNEPADLSMIPEVTKWALGTKDEGGCRYFMFLCREKHDYTIFRIIGKEDEEFQKSLKRLVYSRGIPAGVAKNDILHGYEFWVKDPKQKNEPFMYALFNCNDFVIEIGG